MTSPDPTTRFSNRVADYVKYRPGYPQAVLTVLRSVIGLETSHVVADVGSGTGLSARLFLENGNQVFGVEPNGPMRQAAEETLGCSDRFRSVDGSAEATELAAESIDVVVAAQAFHWFDRDAVRKEWSRILRPEGWVVLLWNERRLDASPFLRAYEQLLVEHSTDYAAIRHENVTADLIRAFLPRDYSRHVVDNEQVFDLEGLKGRLLSSSYVPASGDPRHPAMIADLREIFDAHCSSGRVIIEYDTAIHTGRL